MLASLEKDKSDFQTSGPLRLDGETESPIEVNLDQWGGGGSRWGRSRELDDL